ncbi:MAG TPA: protein-tyrosine-phosphatase [Stellaceae bacterium]|jgi:predicted protein tyrosine phosphatase
MASPPIGLARFRVSVCGIGELPDYGTGGVTHVVSILDPGTPEPEAFGTFPRHKRLELRFNDVIDPHLDYVLPHSRDIESLLEFGREPGPDSHVLIHCHAGQSRSTASATLLIAQARPDLPPERIYAAVVRHRPRAWPNLKILELGDTLLGRGGALAAAAGPVYLAMIEREPILEDLFIDGGRAREVQAAYGR